VTTIEKKINRKYIIGFVLSDKMDKTISVQVERIVKHKKYGKFVKKYTIYKAYDENNEGNIGDKVKLIQARPMSKTKRWNLIEILEKKG